MKGITPILPPLRKCDTAQDRAVSIASNSLLTAMRKAWNILVAGLILPPRALPGIAWIIKSLSWLVVEIGASFSSFY